MNQISVALLFTLFVTSSFGQSNQAKMAERLYENNLYSKAIPKFSWLDRNGELDEIGIAVLADCYFQTGQLEKAAIQYERMISHPAASSKDIIQYVHCLKGQELYSKADKWMEVYLKRNRTDVRALDFKAHKNYFYELNKQDRYYETYLLKTNSRASDFGGYERPGTFDVYFVSSRKTPSVKYRNWQAFQKPAFKIFGAKQGPRFQLVVPKPFDKKLNRQYEYGPMCFTKDGTWVFFTRRERVSFRWKLSILDKAPTWKLCYALVSPTGKWGYIQELPFCNDDYSVGHPTISEDQKTLYFVSDRDDAVGETDIYKADLHISSASLGFGEMTNLGRSINSEGREAYPWIDRDGNLFFATDGRQGYGGLDIYVAFPSSDGNFKALMNIGKPINSPRDDFAFVPKEDGFSGHFSSNRNEGKGGDDIYSFELIKPLVKQYTVTGVITDKETENNLKGAIAILYDEFDFEILRDTTNQDGKYLFTLEMASPYTLIFRSKGYDDSAVKIAKQEVLPAFGEHKMDVDLQLNPDIFLCFDIRERQSGNPLDEVLVHVIDLDLSQEIYIMRTNDLGQIRKKLLKNTFGDCLNYQVVMEKAGHLTKTFQVKHCIDSYGAIFMNHFSDLRMIKNNPGEELTKLLNLTDIDILKIDRSIPKDLEKQLNTIVEILKANPTLTVEIGVHLDCRLDAVQAMRGSDRKAKVISDWMISRVYSPRQIRYKGYGTSVPLNNCSCAREALQPCDESLNEENRRVEFKMLDN
jgi:hypothetical protein